MASDSPSFLQQVDDQVGRLISDWNIYSTIIFLVLVTFLIYPLFFTPEPDTHPFLLARQSAGSRIRQQGETALYRSPDVPHGYPLRSGLNVKDPSAPKWSAGKDGDLRDIWRQAVRGTSEKDKQAAGQVGKVYALHGTEEVEEITFEKLSAELNSIGKHLQKRGGARVAIYLSNSPELLVALFASLFYGLSPVLISQEQSLSQLATILQKTGADTLIVGAGSVPLNELLKQYNGLKEVMWVVPKSSRHLDWNEVPEGEGGKANISVWHEVVEEDGSFASSELPTNDSVPGELTGITLVSPPTDKLHNYEIIEYSQKNFTAAVAAQIAILPHSHGLTANDTLLSLSPLTNNFALTVTLAAIHSNACLALTAVTGESARYESAFNSLPRVSPTIIIADALTLSNFVLKQSDALRNPKGGLLAQLAAFWSRYRHSQKLASIASTGAFPNISLVPGNGSVRLIYTTHVTSPQFLANLRIHTGARIVSALTDPSVAGAISQTHILDYSLTPTGTASSHQSNPKADGHFGPPLSSVEIKLVATPGHEIDDSQTAGGNPEGKLAISGPAVVIAKDSESEVVINDSIWRITDAGTIAVVKRAPKDGSIVDVAELDKAIKASVG